MSGVEVAGFVLAAIPLVIAGIESYGNGVRTIKKIRHCMEELEDLKDDLECEHVKFRHTVEFLLLDAVDDRTLQLLFDDVGGELWANEYVDRCFHGRLQRSYAIFWKSVKSMKRSLQELKRGLDLDVKKNPILDRLKRFAIAFKLKDYRALVEKVQKSNGNIESFVRRSHELMPIRAMRRRYPDFEATRECAKSAYIALQSSMQSACHEEHHASVFLRSIPPQVSSTQLDKSVIPEASQLTVLLRYSALLKSVKCWQNEEVEIRPVELGSGSASGRPLQQMIPIRSQNGQLKRFRHQISAIRDLCGSLQRAQTKVAGVCLGYLAGHPSSQRQGLHRPSKPLTGDPATWESVTLSDLLKVGRQAGLNESNKRRIALSLATGLMRMHDTPWIGGQWGGHDVIIQKAGALIATDHALLTTELRKDNVGRQGKIQNHQYFQSCTLIENETLFSLGLLLAELCLEKSFQELRTQKDVEQAGNCHAFADYLAANRLLEPIGMRAGPRYRDVVRRCIKCELGGSSKSLSDLGFKKAVYYDVVQELEREVEDAYP